MSRKIEAKCSFCERGYESVNRLIGGPKVYICDQCVEICSELVNLEVDHSYISNKDLQEGKIKVNSEIDYQKLPKPAEMKAFLDEYVIGQDLAKKTLCVAVYNHYKRVFAKQNQAATAKSAHKAKLDGEIDNADGNGVEINKSNVLLVGPTGCGKTLLAQTLAKMLDVPFAICDATALTEAGYVGEDVENILVRLVQNANYDIKRAERGIIYIDEIDKITRRSDNPSITRDVSGEGVQQALLKILESTIANIPPEGGRKHPHQEFLQIDTTDILFICGGAFDGLEKVVKRRVNKKTFGFGAEISDQKEHDDYLSMMQPRDLLKFGLIPEFIGRVPVTVALSELDQKSLKKILTEPKNALLKQYQYLLHLDGVELEFTADAVEAIAKEAYDRKTGARGLRSILESLMLDIMYQIPSLEGIKRCIITAEVVRHQSAPQLLKATEAEEVKEEDTCSAK